MLYMIPYLFVPYRDGTYNHTLAARKTKENRQITMDWNISREEPEAIQKIVKKYVAKYGDVPPPWVFRPNSHPYSTQWRMGAGETYCMVYWSWLNENLKSESELIEFFKKYPAPPRWLGSMANTIWKLEPMEESFDYSKYFSKLKNYGFEGIEKYKEDLSNEQYD